MISSGAVKYNEFILACIEQLKKLPFEEAVLYAEQLGILLRSNYLGVYSLNDVESFLIKNAMRFISDEISNAMPDSCHDTCRCLFVATELYQTGGHTRLMERLAGFLNNEANLLFTKPPSQTILNKESSYFSYLYHYGRVKKTCVERIVFIVEVLLKHDLIVLNIHPEDILAAISCGIAKKINPRIKIHFVNHADHTFSYGSSISDVWYEISSYGRCVDMARGLTAQKSYLGIPIEQLTSKATNDYSFNDGDLILTAAARSKYKPHDQATMMPLVDALLTKYKKSTLQVIGANPIRDYWWWSCKLKYRSRLILSKSLPYEEYLKVTSATKLYIDSHPLPGGTAFAEQFLRNRLCTGLISEYKGYTPAELLKRKNVSDVINFIERPMGCDFSHVRELIIKNHGLENVKRRFFNSLFNHVHEQGECSIENVAINPRVTNMITFIPVGFKFFSLRQFINVCYATTKLGILMYLLRYIINSAKGLKRYISESIL